MLQKYTNKFSKECTLNENHEGKEDVQQIRGFNGNSDFNLIQFHEIQC
jgi:hypothetical protein